MSRREPRLAGEQPATGRPVSDHRHGYSASGERPGAGRAGGGRRRPVGHSRPRAGLARLLGAGPGPQRNLRQLGDPGMSGSHVDSGMSGPGVAGVTGRVSPSLALAAVSLTAFFVGLSSTMLSVAVPAIVRHFQAGALAAVFVI